MTRNTIILHREWSSFLDYLSDEELGIWLRSMLRLMQTGELPQKLSRPVEIAFYAAWERIERDWQKLDKRLANLNQNRTKAADAAENVPSDTVNTAKEADTAANNSQAEKKSDTAASESSQAAKKSDTTDTQPLLEQLVRQCTASLPQPPKKLREELARALARFGPELTQAIVQNCLAHSPGSWSYLRRAFLNAAQLGLNCVQDYQSSCLRATGQMVDRASPSTNDILLRGLHRPLTLKRPA